MNKSKLDEVEKSAHWGDDRLERWKAARDFSKLILALPKKENEAWVVCLDAPYGAGKSFIVNRWQKDLASEKYGVCTLTYNAWDFDYSDDAFTSFSAEIIEQLAVKVRTGYEELFEIVKEMEKFYKLVWPLFKYMKNIPDVPQEVMDEIGVVKDLVQKGKDVIEKGKSFHAEVKTTPSDRKKQKLIPPDILTIHREAKEAAAGFKEFLEKATEVILKKTGKPLVIFVDEIDRCKPTFAIRLLERIKHVFNVPNIVFVVMTNKRSLAHSIRAVYGQSFLSEEYLERFVDLSLTLPNYDSTQYIDSLLANYTSQIKNTETASLIKAYSNFFKTCSTMMRLSLREQRKSLELASLALPALPHKDLEHKARNVLLCQFIFVCCLKNCSFPDLYSSLGEEMLHFTSFYSKMHDLVETKSMQGSRKKVDAIDRENFRFIVESLFFNHESKDELRGRYRGLDTNQLNADFLEELLVGLMFIIDNTSRLTEFAIPVVKKATNVWQPSDTTFASYIRRYVDYIG